MKRFTLWIIVFFGGLTLVLNWGFIESWKHQQYIYLAQSFLHGKSYFLQIPGSLVDTVNFRGEYYWPLGPLPAILLTFPVWIWGKWDGVFQQGYMNFLVVLGVWGGAVTLARRVGYLADDAVWLGTAFCFASVLHLPAMVPVGWYLLQSLTAFLSIWAINEWWVYRRYWVIGVLMAMVFAARPTAALGGIFFTGMILLSREGNRRKWMQLVELWAPVLVTGFLWLCYNRIRFGNWMTLGFSEASVGTAIGRSLLNNGKLFELSYIPRNIYFYLFNLDTKNVMSFPGTSFFVVSPVFLYLFRAKFNRRVVKSAALAVLVIFAAVLMYYWPGPVQTGPRYLIDLLPFLYLMLLYSFPDFRLTKLSKMIITVSMMVNLALLKSILPAL